MTFNIIFISRGDGRAILWPEVSDFHMHEGSIIIGYEDLSLLLGNNIIRYMTTGLWIKFHLRHTRELPQVYCLIINCGPEWRKEQTEGWLLQLRT